MKRIQIKDLNKEVGKKVNIAGWVDTRRDHGKLIFIDLRDSTGFVQAVALPKHEDAQKSLKESRSEWVVEIEGMVNKRPENMVNKNEENGDIEIEVLGVKVLSKADEIPFEKEGDLNIDVYLDNLPLTLRSKKAKSIFRVQSTTINSFRNFLSENDFIEIQAPKLIGEDAEGGANSFAVEYFGHIAHLAQSPQLYKQIMVGIFEKVFVTGNVYRAEKHSTTRHLNEYTSLDFEMGFIKDHTDIMRVLNNLLIKMMTDLREKNQKDFDLFGAEIPEVPKEIPFMKLCEAQEIIKKEFGEDCSGEPDLEPQHERWLCEYAKKKFNSDFIFITHFPVSKRPFYTYEDEDDPGYTKGFDLLFRGVELVTGAQRIHEYDKLVESMKKKKLDPEKFEFYLKAFKYGMPPHGGIGLGLERLTAKLFGLENVKEASLFPRDLNRIDNLLSR